MLAMRLKILSTAPLPELKVWFSLESPDTVASLKYDLCARVKALRDAGLRASDICLVLDDFELLNESSSAILRDGDLVHVTKAVSVKRRGSSQDGYPPGPFKRQKLGPRHQNAPQIDCSGVSSSESTSGSDSESTSGTSSSSTTSDSDSSSSSSSHRLHPIKPRPSNVPPNHNAPLIPPGQGKPATHSRNQRRRIKRQHDKANKSIPSTAPNGTSVANAQPLGRKRTQEDMGLDNASNPEYSVVMASLRNKNKKKGFKNSMANPLPRKIVFGDGTDIAFDLDAPTALPFAGVKPDFEVASSTRLIPPSEKQDKGMLPENILVTSVDVEEGVRRQKNGKKWRVEEVTDENRLDYGQKVPEVQDTATGVGEVDFAAAEAGWENFPKVTSITQLCAEKVVGWKALMLNPRTHSPEVLVNIARIIKCDVEGVIVHPFSRPVAFGVIDRGEDAEEIFTWKDVVNEWRLL